MAGSRPSSATITPPPVEENQYSTLEVDQNRFLENDDKAAPILGEVDTNDEKMISYGQEGKVVSYDDVGKQTVVEVSSVHGDSTHPANERKIMGLKRRTFFILLPVVVVVLIAAAIGGGIGGSITARNRDQHVAVPSPSPNPSPSPTSTSLTTSTRGLYANTGLAAMRWTDLNGTLHKRIYYQDSSDKVRESAWDNSTAFDASWAIQAISDPVKPGTPIAAAAGYPHASYNYTLVKNVYYMSATNELFERQAPSNDSQGWKDDNFSGLYSGSNSTFLTAYWNQNIQNVTEELVVLFQEDNFANGITQGRYTSNATTSNPWVANNFGFSQPKGSTWAMALVSYRSGKHLMLYTVDDSKTLQQHQYEISDTVEDSTTVVALISESSTGLTVEPRSPLAVVAQDNGLLYTANQPECVSQTPLAQLILYAVPDRSSLGLNAWNCTTGFVDQTSEIAPLQKPNTTFLSLAAMSDRVTGDGNVYIMFDSGSSPQVEEWMVPKRAGDPWVTSRNVTMDFAL